MPYCVALLVILLDQLTKHWVLWFMADKTVWPVAPFFNLVLTFNKGVSFSFLSSTDPAMPFVLAGVSLVIAAVIVRWISVEKRGSSRLALGLVLGGAIGNVIDRLRFGGVVDFLDFYVQTAHWPAFNVADSAICVGAAVLLFNAFQKGEQK